MKKIVAIALIMNLCFSLCACGSSAKTDAKEKFKNENYEDVVAILEKEENLDDEMTEMLTVSKANVAYSNNDYIEVISILQDSDTKQEQEIYVKSMEVLLDKALNEYNTELLVTLYSMDTSIEDSVFEAIINKANAFEYSAFCFVDELINELPEGYLRNKLSTYYENNEKTRVKAFLRGDWKMVYDAEIGDEAIVTIHVYEEDSKCVAFLTKVSTFMERYFYEVNDLYWQDFSFENNQPISIHTLVRYTDGSTGGSIASFKLDMEAGEIHIHVTDTDVSDRIWQKVF